MWTRAELKSRAKAGLKNYYWMAILVLVSSTVISGLVTGIAGMLIIAAPLAGIFFNNVLFVGAQCDYYIKSIRNRTDAGLGEMFSGFQNGKYMRYVSVQFFRALFTVLWSMLLVIPGIIKHYEYYMVGYLVSEYPEKSRKEIFAMSKQMMDGNKFSTFILELSFFGWLLLGTLACGIGILFVIPYMNATMAELYLQLKEERLGILRNNPAYMSGMDTNYSSANQSRNVVGIDMNNMSRANNYQNSNYDENNEKILNTHSQSVDESVQTVKKGYLTGVKGEFAGASIPIDRGEVLKIGRDAGQCNVIVKGAQISRLHFTVEFDGYAFRVTDHSTYGTFSQKNGQIPSGQAVILQSGTYLRMGTEGDIFLLECK